MIIETWKPYGITSTQFVKNYQEKNKFIKATCTGRLDPLAQGKLIILTDNDTKKMQTFLKREKTYKFDMILGVSTESHDCLSKITEIQTERLNENNLNNRFIISKLHEFIARYKIQKFPLVSSFVINHQCMKKPLWWFYKNGIRDIILPEKQIRINYHNVFSVHKIDGNSLSELFIDRIQHITDTRLQTDLNTSSALSQWKIFKEKEMNFIVVSMELNVSTGFYVRRFCHDFGNFIGTGGIAFDITRTEIE